MAASWPLIAPGFMECTTSEKPKGCSEPWPVSHFHTFHEMTFGFIILVIKFLQIQAIVMSLAVFVPCDVCIKMTFISGLSVMCCESSRNGSCLLPQPPCCGQSLRGEDQQKRMVFSNCGCLNGRSCGSVPFGVPAIGGQKRGAVQTKAKTKPRKPRAKCLSKRFCLNGLKLAMKRVGKVVLDTERRVYL